MLSLTNKKKQVNVLHEKNNNTVVKKFMTKQKHEI